MAASRSDIEAWFVEGKKRAATHLVVVTDTFSMDDYPVYVGADADARAVVQEYEAKPMQRVAEAYDLGMDMAAQMRESRAWHC